MTWIVLAVLKVHDKVVLPEPVAVGGDTVHDVLFVVKATTPENPLIAATVIIDVTVVLTSPVTDVGFALRVKS